jgi:hypothetical protein
VLYAVDLRWLDSGDGPPWSPGEVLAGLGTSLFGVPAAWTPLSAIPALAVAAFCVALVRRRDPRWPFFVLVLAGPLVLIVTPAEIMGVRFLAAAMVFALPLLGGAIQEWVAVNRAGRIAAAVCVALLCASGVHAALRLADPGRGQHAAALRYIAESSGSSTTVGSDHDGRNGLLVAYFAHELGIERRVRYSFADGPAGDAPEWFIVHDDAALPLPHPATLAVAGHVYTLRREFAHWGAGWHWFVYRRAGYRDHE